MRVSLFGIMIPKFWLSDVSAKFSCMYCNIFLICSFSCFICSFSCLSCSICFFLFFYFFFQIFNSHRLLNPFEFIKNFIHRILSWFNLLSLFEFSVRINFFKFCKYFLCVSSSSILSITSKNTCLSTFEDNPFIVLFFIWNLFIFVELLFSTLFLYFLFFVLHNSFQCFQPFKLVYLLICLLMLTILLLLLNSCL